MFVSELLSSRTFKLLGLAKNKLKPAGFKFIWAKKDIIHARQSDNAIRHTIFSPGDIEKLIQLYIKAGRAPASAHD